MSWILLDNKVMTLYVTVPVLEVARVVLLWIFTHFGGLIIRDNIVVYPH